MTEHPATPASRFIARFGVQQLVKWTGRDRSRIHAWTWPKARGGTGGLVPHAVRPGIIDGAKADLGEGIAHADFEPQGDEVYLTDAQPEAAQ